MEIISSIYNSGYNIKRLFLGEQELKLAYLGEQIVFNEVIDDLNYVLYEFYKGKAISSTIEAPVKSAILKGQTLVNDVNLKRIGLTSGNTLSSDGYITITANSSFSNAFVGYKKVKPNTKYLCIVDIKEYTANGPFSLTSKSSESVFNVSTTINSGETGIKKFVLTSNDTIDGSVVYYSFRSYLNSLSTNGHIKYRVMMIEYQDGMEKWDIPYFEGMQSVKMPVLTTSNEDGTKTNTLTVNEGVTLRGIGDVRDELNCLTGEVVQRVGEIILNGVENWSADKEFTNTYRFYLKINDMVNRNWTKVINNPPFVKSNTFRSLDLRTEAHNLDTEHLTGWDLSRIILNISKERLSEFSVDALKTYIQKNPITVQYQLATESTKTVDLTMVDQDEQTISKLNSFNGTTHVSTEVAENGIYPTIAIEVATE